MKVAAADFDIFFFVNDDYCIFGMELSVRVLVRLLDSLDILDDIKSLDKENKKISLGYKKAEDNPWEILRRDYPVDTVIDSEIVGLTSFGAFATVIPGIDGLIHISQIADQRIGKPADVLKIGEKVKCKITAIDFDKNRVSLSIRALLPKADEAAEDAAEEAPAEEAAEAPVEE